MNALTKSVCPDLKLLARGKVRDIYEVDDRHLLFVATDRISAFDVVMSNGIPGKGRILNQMSLFWFSVLKEVCPNHVAEFVFDRMPAVVRQYRAQLEGRSILVRRLRILPVEAIVRGYLAGSGWKEYRASGTVCGIPLPTGLQESSRLPEPLFTPSTKAAIGSHDENISPDRAAEILGPAHAAEVARLAIALYRKAAEVALPRGLLLADTKFEFGLDDQDRVVLADEALTPDSSRYWPAAAYAPGRGQDSFDKQYLRDYLERIHFDKQTPVALPEDVIQQTLSRYIEAYRLLTGLDPAL